VNLSDEQTLTFVPACSQLCLVYSRSITAFIWF